MKLIDKLCIHLLEHRYQVHVRRSGEFWKAELPGKTIRARTLPEMEAELYALEDD